MLSTITARVDHKPFQASYQILLYLKSDFSLCLLAAINLLTRSSTIVLENLVLYQRKTVADKFALILKRYMHGLMHYCKLKANSIIYPNWKDIYNHFYKKVKFYSC